LPLPGNPRKFQHHRIAHKFAGGLLQWCNAGKSLLFDGCAVRTRQEALIVQCAELPLQRTGCPTLIGGFVHVPLPSLIAFYAQKRPVVRPAQFVTQRVTNRKCLIKQAHIAQVGSVKALPELFGQGSGQSRQQSLAIFCPRSSPLFKFDNVPADLPASLYLNNVHGPQDLLARLLNQLAETPQQRPKVFVITGCLL
jgi:hypothetical protein